MSEANELRVIRYTIELKTPLLATDVQGEPNGAVSVPFLPGALLRGALVGSWLADKNKSGFDAVVDEDAHALFLSDETRFLNAYPINKEDKRALPQPVAWRQDKEQSGSGSDARVFDLSRKSFDVRDGAVSGDFCWWSSTAGKAERFTPQRRLNVHTQRDARKGRPTEIRQGDEVETLGTIYRYDALAAGLQLKAAILTTEKFAPTFEKLLRGKSFWIGRARRAGYGNVEIISVETADYWRENDATDSPRSLSAGEPLRITFTSDVLLRDQYGQATLDPRAALAKELKATLEPIDERTWAETKVVGGFNRKWGLPLPQTVALAAGSVFVYRADTAISAAALETLEQRGIGERRNEGFGRLIVNWLQKESEQFESSEYHPSPITPKLAKPDQQETKYAQAIARRILRSKLDEALLARITYTKLKSPMPHKNQLVRLRVILRSVQAGRKPGMADTEQLVKYVDDLQQRRTARKQFERARVNDNDTPLVDWIKDQLDNAQQQWSGEIALGEGDIQVKLSVKDDAALAQEYALRLIDQVLYRATKASA